MPDAHLALRRLRDEPVREAVSAVFATPVASEAFLPEASTDADIRAGADAARASLAEAMDRLASVTGAGEDTVSIAYETARLASTVRAVRPRLLAQAIAGWVVFAGIADIACGGDAWRSTAAFDDWDGAAAVGDLARRAGSGDAQAWRAVELTRALLAIAPGDLVEAADQEGLPQAWFTSEAVRAAAGWNEWEGAVYLAQEAWDELVDAVAERDMLLGLPSAANAAAELRRRAAMAGYQLGGDADSSDAVTQAHER